MPNQYCTSQHSETGFAARFMHNEALVYDLRTIKHGKHWFFIIKVKPDKHAAYLHKVNSTEGFDLEDYGEVLHSGEGEPSGIVKEELRKKYGMYA